MTLRYSLRVFILAIAAVVNGVAEAEDSESKRPFTVRFVDDTGKPVADAIAGVTAYFGSEGSTLPAVDKDGWHYFLDGTSDENGYARLPDGVQYDRLCLVARHTGQRLVAIEKMDSAKFDPEKNKAIPTITMHPACLVSGSLTCGDLTRRNRGIGWTNVFINRDDKRAFGCTGNEPTMDQKFHFFLPAGEFTLEAYGYYCHSIEKKIIVKPGMTELKLDRIDLPAKRVALLQGLPAPELVGAVAWKNGPPIKLADLKGKCVIVEFWGHWCGPCIYRMPDLFKVYDQYHDRGLEVVAVHVDLGEREKVPVNSAERLEERLSKVRKDVWKGRDIPYPIALFIGKPVPFGPAEVALEARCQIAADYGVTHYPSMILIDRQGNVVDRFEPTQKAHIELLEKLLDAK